MHHFVTLRANRSLRGGDKWSGFGGAGLKPAGDERFSTANALTLESYITDRWTKNPVNVLFFANVITARNYIGPAAAVAGSR